MNFVNDVDFDNYVDKYKNLSLKDKKELMTLVTALITKKYGSWHDNDIYNSSKKKLPYRLRMKLIEYFIEPYDTSKETEESLKEKVKQGCVFATLFSHILFGKKQFF